MKVLKFILLLFVLLMFNACPLPFDEVFRFHNNSPRDVYIDWRIIDRDYGGTLFLDTAISKTGGGTFYKQGENYYFRYNSGTERLFKKNDTMILFIFDADSFDMYSWEEIQRDYKILQRYDISYENMKYLKYNITYPPTEAMKDVKMYPPYE